MEKKTKYIIVGSVVYTMAAVAVGRYTVPEKVKIETKTVTVEKIVTVKDTNKDVVDHKKVTTHEIDKPDGTKDITTVVADDTDAKTIEKDVDKTDVASKSDTIKEVTRGDSKVTISALGGMDLTNLKPVLGLSVTKPILGPFTLGAFYLNDQTLGMSIGLTF